MFPRDPPASQQNRPRSPPREELDYKTVQEAAASRVTLDQRRLPRLLPCPARSGPSRTRLGHPRVSHGCTPNPHPHPHRDQDLEEPARWGRPAWRGTRSFPSGGAALAGSWVCTRVGVCGGGCVPALASAPLGARLAPLDRPLQAAPGWALEPCCLANRKRRRGKGEAVSLGSAEPGAEIDVRRWRGPAGAQERRGPGGVPSSLSLPPPSSPSSRLQPLTALNPHRLPCAQPVPPTSAACLPSVPLAEPTGDGTGDPQPV